MTTENIVTVGALARFEAKPGNEADVERFFLEGLPIVQLQKASTLWFRFRLGPTTFGAFGAFANEARCHGSCHEAQSSKQEIPTSSEKYSSSKE